MFDVSKLIAVATIFCLIGPLGGQNTVPPAADIAPADAAAQAPASDPAPALSVGTALRVNGEALTTAQIINLLRQDLENPQRREQFERNPQKFIQTTVPDLVRAKLYGLLLYQYAKVALEKLEVPEEALDKVLEDKKKEFLKQYGGSEAQARLELAKKGLNLEDLLAEERRQIVIQGYQDMHFLPTQTVTRIQMLQYYRAHLEDEFSQTGNIQFQLIDIQKQRFNDPDQAAANAQAALQKIQDGEDFTAVVREHSHGFRKSYDGMWRPTDPGSVRSTYKPVIEALAKIAVNETTGLIETEGRFFIAKLIDRQEARVIPFSEAQFSINETIRRQRWLKYTDKLTTDLLEKASIGDLLRFIDNTIVVAYKEFIANEKKSE